MHAFRAFIEEQMKDRKWIQADLVRASELTAQHISKLLKDQREVLPRLPRRETLEGIAKGFNVPLSVVVLRAAAACGVPVDVAEVEIPSARALSTDELLSEVRRRIERATEPAQPASVADIAPTRQPRPSGPSPRLKTAARRRKPTH